MVSEALPLLPVGATMREAVVQLAERRGLCVIVEADGRMAGVITTGDLTRLMEREAEVFSVPVERVMTRSPKHIAPEALGSAAVHLMETAGVVALPVVGTDDRVVGVVHLHDLLRAGAA